MAGPYEKVLAAEMVVVMGTQTADALSGAESGTFKLPDPSRYFAAMVVFGLLAGAAMFGDRVGKLAAQFGGVAAIAILVNPSKTTGRAPVMGLLAYLTQIVGGTQRPVAGTSAGSGPSTAPPTRTTINPGAPNAGGMTLTPTGPGGSPGDILPSGGPGTYYGPGPI